MINFFAKVCDSVNPNGIISGDSLPKTCADKTTLDTVFLIIFALIGSIALLVFVIAGARYAFSKGEPDKVQSAKNEMKNAAIGLVITALAAAIVNFVIDKVQ